MLLRPGTALPAAGSLICKGAHSVDEFGPLVPAASAFGIFNIP